MDIAKKVISFFENSKEFNIFLIAHADGDRVGSIAVSLKSDKTAFINFLLVNIEYRGRGIGKMLMEKAIEYTQSRDMKILRLETYSCLENARGLYKKFGFKPYEINERGEKYSQIFDQEFWEKRL